MTSKTRIKKMITMAVSSDNPLFDIDHNDIVTETFLDIQDVVALNDLIEPEKVSILDNTTPLDNNHENTESYDILPVMTDSSINIDKSNSSKVSLSIRKRNIKADRDSWKRVKTKNDRMHGNEYLGYQREGQTVSHNSQRQKRKQKLTCSSEYCKKAINRFCNVFDDEERKNMFSSFWDSSWEEKRTLVVGLVLQCPKKKQRHQTSEVSRRQSSFSYHLWHNDQSLQVCKKMFMGTFGLNEWMVSNWVKCSTGGLVKKTVPTNKVLVNETNTLIPSHTPVSTRNSYLSDWFNNLPKMPSHYCRKRSSRLYLEGPFKNVQDIFNVYKKKCSEDLVKPFSKCYFVEYMREKKLSIYIPRKDLCDYCSSYDVGQVTEDDYAEHIAHKNRAREEKELDKIRAEKNECFVYTMDMQAVKLCPSIQASALYYSMKLKVHNVTLYNISTHECENYWWQETDGGLEASIFATILIKHIEKFCLGPEKKPVIIYTDGCGYQNRNNIMSNALLNFSVQHNVSIEQKFLIKGHTQMECDSTHSLIERKLKGRNIHLPSDFITLTKEARIVPFSLGATQLDYDYFIDYKNNQVYNSIRPGKQKNDPEVKDIRSLWYDPNDGEIKYKLNFDEPYTSLPQRKMKAFQSSLRYNQLYNTKIPLTLSKWQDLQKLKQVLPKDTHSFYDTLPHLEHLEPKKGKVLV